MAAVTNEHKLDGLKQQKLAKECSPMGSLPGQRHDTRTQDDKEKGGGTSILDVSGFRVSLFYWHSCCIHLCKLPACLSMLAA